MLPSFSRGPHPALVLVLGAGFLAWHGHGHVAYAQGDDEEEDADSADGDAGGAEEEEAEDKDQPAVTAGGLFTMSSYPVNEILRPLTITQKIAQVRLSLGTDLSAKGAFESAGVSLEGQYGMADNFMVIGGFTSAYNAKQFGVYGGFEGSLIYDLLDVRLAANVHRNAFAEYENFNNPDGSQSFLPNGQYDNGDIKFSLDLGFPFRYAIKPEIAIVALQTLISIDFNSSAEDRIVPGQNGNMPVANDAKPDLNPSLGIATNPIPQLSLVALAQLRIPDFDTAAGAFQVPVTGRLQFSTSQKLDIGLEFTLLNVMPPEGQSPIDNRFLSLFVQSRFGK